MAWALSYLSTLSRAEIKINGAVSRLPICLLGVCRDSFTLTLTLLSYLTLKKIRCERVDWTYVAQNMGFRGGLF